MYRINRIYFKMFSSCNNDCKKHNHDYTHLKKLVAMYESAPISGKINEHCVSYDLSNKFPSAAIKMESSGDLNHPGGSLHGSVYFKLLDDAAWFTAQAVVNDNFIFTTSFTTYIVRPVLEKTKLHAFGKIINVSKSLIIAESTVVEENTNKIVATGSGTFMKGPIPLNNVDSYRIA